MDKHYDFIIAGGGCSGLMLAYKMAQDPWFDNRSILIIDKVLKNTNDRTWCFWEKGGGVWDNILSKNWSQVFVGNEVTGNNYHLGQYCYKMLRSSDFYRVIHDLLHTKPNFTLLTADITRIEEVNKKVTVDAGQDTFYGDRVFSSIFDLSLLTAKKDYPYLKQHFIGWFVKMSSPTFDSNLPKMMDFSVAQKGNTRFMYVLPLSSEYALIEYTLFSDTLLPTDEYENEIIAYIEQKYPGVPYTIEEKEIGDVPMSCYPLEKINSANIMHIGTAGGWTKPSSGYTFSVAMRNTSALMEFIKREVSFTKFKSRRRHWYYDWIMLDVLFRNNSLGSSIFTNLFRKNSIESIFAFLNEESSIYEDLKIMFSSPYKIEFTRSFIRGMGVWLKP